MNRTDRLYALVEELRAVAPRPRSARWLATRFEVSTRTVERDISALQQSGVPIWVSLGRTGGYALDRSHTLPPLNMTPAEAVAGAVALHRLDDTPFHAAARTALHKLLAVMPAADVTRAEDLAARIHLVQGTPRGRSSYSTGSPAAVPPPDAASTTAAVPAPAVAPGAASPTAAVPAAATAPGAASATAVVSPAAADSALAVAPAAASPGVVPPAAATFAGDDASAAIAPSAASSTAAPTAVSSAAESPATESPAAASINAAGSAIAISPAGASSAASPAATSATIAGSAVVIAPVAASSVAEAVASPTAVLSTASATATATATARASATVSPATAPAVAASATVSPATVSPARISPARVSPILVEAFTTGRVLDIAYADRFGVTTRRQIEPAGYLGGPAGWYLLAWCRLRGDLRSFRIDRIHEVVATAELAARRPLPDGALDIPGHLVRRVAIAA